MNALDCPDGLARCVDGVIEVSRLATIALPCNAPADKCQCPWDRIGNCDHGCVVDDLDLVMPRTRAFAQLCAPAAADVIARPPAQGIALPSGVCGGELYRCVGGTIVVCNDGPGDPIALATCVRGCAEEASALDEEGLTKDQVAALLCKH
jgi:hypothetical protein